METMEASNLFALIRTACTDINKAKGEKFFNVKQSDTELAKAFIEYCKTTEDENVPESASDAWSKIPAEWEDDETSIPVVEAPKRPRTRAAKPRVTNRTRDEEGKCTKFGSCSLSSKRCIDCEKNHSEEYESCKAVKMARKEEGRLARAAKREADKAERLAKREAEKAAKAAMTPEEREALRMESRKKAFEKQELSRYGHRLGSTAAFIDEAIWHGINHEDLVRRILEVNPDTTEDKARIKVRDHINYLPKKRGIVVTITKADNAPDFYKTEVEEWCKDPSVAPTANIIDDKRTPRPKVADKK